MVTKNYFRLIQNILISGTSNTLTSRTGVSFALARKNVYQCGYLFMDPTSNISNNLEPSDVVQSENASVGPVKSVAIGTGTSAATVNDIDLASMITSEDVECISTAGAISDKMLTYTKTIYNGGASNITVNEIGLFCSGYANQLQAGAYLLAREVFNSPVIVKPGKTASFSITIRLDY